MSSLSQFSGGSGGRQIFTTSGIFTVPSNVHMLVISAVGGGSGGDDGYLAASAAGTSGSSGGEVYRLNLPALPGDQITITVGTGGAPSGLPAGQGYSGNAGGDTVITSVDYSITLGGGVTTAVPGTVTIPTAKLTGISSNTSTGNAGHNSAADIVHIGAQSFIQSNFSSIIPVGYGGNGGNGGTYAGSGAVGDSGVVIIDWRA